MADDTAGAMDHLRQSCAIAAGKAPPPPPPYRPEVDPFGERQVTCWETGVHVHCCNCGKRHPIFTDGRLEWVACDRADPSVP